MLICSHILQNTLADIICHTQTKVKSEPSFCQKVYSVKKKQDKENHEFCQLLFFCFFSAFCHSGFHHVLGNVNP